MRNVIWRLGVIVAVLAVPASASAQHVFGNSDGCDAYRSGVKSGIPVYWAQGDKFVFGSNDCSIDKLEKMGGGVQSASLTCVGIGGTSNLEYGIFETDDPNRVLIHMTGIPQSRQGLRRCP